jgi:hypothetical protein
MGMVQLLLENGAGVNAAGGRYGSALQAASVKGNLDICRLLLENDAGVNTVGGTFGSALQVASFHGHVEFVELLLENGAEVNAAGGEYDNALQAASVGGNMEICRLLLQYSADVNATGGEHGSALQAASRNGHVDTVRLLLEKGADVNVFGGSTLKAAARFGRLHPYNLWKAKLITRILLEHGAHEDMTAYDSEEDGMEFGPTQDPAFLGRPRAPRPSTAERRMAAHHPSCTLLPRSLPPDHCFAARTSL